MLITRILIVEDAMVTAKHLQVSLTGCGYEAKWIASTGAQAVRLANEERPDIVLMDIMLDGDMDGIEAAQRIRSNLDIPIIFLSAYSDEAVLKRAKLTEPSGYLLKPFRVEELRTTIEIALHKHKTEKNLKEREECLRKALLGSETDLTKTQTIARIGHWVLDPETGEMTASDELFDIFDLTREEASFEEFAGVVHADDRELRLHHINRGLEYGESWDIEYRLLCKGGAEKWVHSIGEAIVDERGKTALLLGIAHDITERKQLEEALEEEKHLRFMVLDALPYPAMIVRGDRTIVSANRVALEMGACVGGFCWQTFRQSKYIPDEDRKYIDDHRRIPPGGTHCDFCLADEALVSQQSKNDPEVRALGRIWDTHWVPINHEVFLHYAIDVTDRIEAEAEVQRKNTFLSSVLNALDHPFYVINADDYTISLANPAARLSGVSEGSTCYSAAHGLTVPCQGLSHPCPLQEVKETGLPARAKHVHRDQEGKPRSIEVHAHPILDGEGRMVQLIEYCLDVTERVQAQESLRENERMMATILSLSPSGITYYRDGHNRWVNRAAMELFGYDEADRDIYLSIATREFYESEEEYERVLEIFRAQIAEGKTAEAEARLRRKDGSIFIGHVSISSRKSDGPGEGQTVIVSDVSERKKAEEELVLLKTAIDQADESVVVTDAGTIIQYVNPAFESLTGYTAREAIGQHLQILRSGERDAELYREMFDTLGRGKTWSGRLVHKKKDGTLFEDEASISPVEDGSGNIVSYVAVMHDVTDQIMLEKQLRQAQKLESVGTLAGGIAHDFNNILQVVLASTNLLILDKDKQSKDYSNLETIRRAVKSGRDLVKGLLTFTRQVDSSLRSVDMNQLLKSVQAILKRTIPKTIDIELSLAADLNSVTADPVQVEQVLINLAVNARDAMPEGGKLTLETRNVTLDEDYCRTNVETKPGHYVMLKVSDTGHGMAQEVMDRIWEPFFTTKEVGEGTGLGLSIVYGIVKNHGGHITCSSETGRGTSFTIYITAIQAKSEQDMAMAVGEMPETGTETILLVDDEESIRDTVGQILEQSGYSVYKAGNGNDALKIYRSKMEEIDLVVLDLMMPEINGWQCIEEIFKMDPKSKVVVTSGVSGIQSAQRALEAGASEFLAKPFPAGDLLRVLRRVLDETGSEESRSSDSGTMSEGSAAEEGTTRTIQPAISEAAPPEEKPGAEESPWRLKALVIDDREPYLAMLKAGLAQFGHAALTASSGIKGLHVFQEAPVNLVICDLGMPEMDGWEVSRKIKEVCREKAIPKPPFILLTGETDMEDMHEKDRAKMAECGVDAIVGKPIDIPDLLDVAEALIRRRQEERD